MQNDSVLILFGRAPVPGRVKTRLFPAVGKRKATEIYQRLFCQTLEVAQQSEFKRIELWVDGSTNHPFFRRVRKRYGYRFYPQLGQGLGRRMQYAINHALGRYRSVVLLGCDCSGLTADDLNQARQSLKAIDVVLGPAIDGGYYLIGLNKALPCLFTGMPWGSKAVLKETIKRVKFAGLQYQELARHRDIDNSSDVTRLITGQYCN